MRRVILSGLVIALTFAAVMATMMPSAKAEVIVFTAQMLASNEAPPVAVAPSEANTTGQAIVTLTTTVTGGVITAATARFDVTLTGMASNTVIILSHIHEGAAGVNGPVRVDSGLSPASPVPTAGGVATFSRDNLPVTPAIAQAIINNPAGWYFNSHSALSPAGIARGQLVRLTTGTGLPAPTLSQWGAILMTLLFLAAGTFFLVGRTRTVEAVAGGLVLGGDSFKAIDWKLLAKVALYVEVAIGLSLIALSAGLVDVLGALTSGLVAAFIIHLFIGSTRRT